MKVIETNLKWAYALTARSATTHLILHHSGSEKATAESIHSYHLSKGWAGMAYHYLVAKDGRIFRGRPEKMRGGHTTDYNWCSIGICFEGNFENETMSAAQLAAGGELVRDIMSRYPGIVVGGHREYGATACPGKLFPEMSLFTGAPEEPKSVDAQSGGEPADWAREACLWAVEAGLFQGDGSGSCNWEKKLSRQELAVILKRFFELRVS